MAKFITDENIRLNVIINGSPAQKELLDLETSTRKLTATNKELKAERLKLVAAGKKESSEYKKLSTEIKANNKVITSNKVKMQELQKEIGVTGLTLSQLKKKAALLRMKLEHAIPGGEAAKKYTAELKKIDARLLSLKSKAKGAKLSISSLANGFNKYAAMGASFLAMGTGIVISAQKIIDYNGKLSDSQSDVMKTTGMNKKEVDALTSSLGMLQTRTSRMDLLKIAEEGGRIGIAKDEIGEFVKVMNKANVALGDSFSGGVEEVASKLGKLKLLFKQTKDLKVDEAYNGIGSAINELGANGVATEVNIANFATRVGSLPDAIKPSITDALGLGAAFEESGIQAEIAARGYNIFLKQASSNSEKFAKVMGVTTEEVENMINTNPTEFFLEFSAGLKGMNATDTANTLKYLGLNAEGTNKIIGAAGNNQARFKELLDLSNNSMGEASSLTSEYNIKNNNLAATLDKIKKKTMGWFSSDGLVSWLTASARGFAKLIGATDHSTESLESERIAVLKLESRIKNVNITQGQRVKLIEEFQKRYPGFLANLDAEKVTNNQLTGAIKEVNKQLINKIILQEKDAEIEDQLRDTAELKMSHLNQEENVRERMVKLANKHNLAIKENATLQEQAADIVKKIGITGGVVLDPVAKLSHELNDLKIIQGQLNYATDVSNQLSEKRNSLAEKFNLTLPTGSTEPTNENGTVVPTEGDTKIIGGVTFVFKNGSWGPVHTYNAVTPNENDESVNQYKKAQEEITTFIQKQQEQRLLNKKTGLEKELAEIDAVFQTEIEKAGENHEIVKELEALRDLEKNDLKIERKSAFEERLKEFNTQLDEEQKLTDEEKEIADYEKKLEDQINELERLQLNKDEQRLLLTMLAEQEEMALAKIRGKYRKKEEKEEAAKVKGKKKLNQEIVNSAISAAGQETRVGQALLAVKGIMAAKEMLIKLGVLKGQVAVDAGKATSAIAVGSAQTAKVGFPQNIPLIIGFMAQVAGIVSAIKGAANVKVSSKGYQKGLYPVVREQDGKSFNAAYGGATTSGLVSKPTLFSTNTGSFLAGEQGAGYPELIIDGDAYKKMNPDIKYSVHREIARVKGFQQGIYPDQVQSSSVVQTSTADNSVDYALVEALNRNSQILEKIETSGVTAVMSPDLRNAKKMQEYLDDYQSLKNKNRA